MDNTSTFEAYMMFRMTEAEHIAKTNQGWVFQSSNTEYEAFALDAYDRALKTNSTNWGDE